MIDLRRAVFSTALCAGLAAGCGGEQRESPATPTAAPAPTAPAPANAAAADEEAKQIFATRCFTCHGVSGAGNGPASAGLTPQPRNLMDPEWQKSVTDDHIEKIIQYGGAAVGKSAAMPSNPDLNAKPEVVTALRVFVRNLAR